MAKTQQVSVIYSEENKTYFTKFEKMVGKPLFTSNVEDATAYSWKWWAKVVLWALRQDDPSCRLAHRVVIKEFKIDLMSWIVPKQGELIEYKIQIQTETNEITVEHLNKKTMDSFIRWMKFPSFIGTFCFVSAETFPQFHIVKSEVVSFTVHKVML